MWIMLELVNRAGSFSCRCARADFSGTGHTITVFTIVAIFGFKEFARATVSTTIGT